MWSLPAIFTQRKLNRSLRSRIAAWSFFGAKCMGFMRVRRTKFESVMRWNRRPSRMSANSSHEAATASNSSLFEQYASWFWFHYLDVAITGSNALSLSFRQRTVEPYAIKLASVAKKNGAVLYCSSVSRCKPWLLTMSCMRMSRDLFIFCVTMNFFAPFWSLSSIRTLHKPRLIEGEKCL